MQRITIGRYGIVPDDIPRPADPTKQPAQDMYAGWVEGVRNDGSEWVLFIDKDGSPQVYWPTRAEDGGVEGDPVALPRYGNVDPPSAI